uniref:Uncharacterized protein n=1 Tax=uncultured Armatimonadetes bacterium TaxID=157466 RepID=A0A6J4INC5_9BACT|nr:hypothetical protein AVDCRST_MAG63-2221 [uncultured Armatimonadetes bacterium]
MKFFTRELYQSLQPGSGVPYHTANRRWKAASAANQEHQAAIRPRLPESMRAFAETTLHDGRIEQADWPAPEEVRLLIDGSDCPWGPAGRFELVFRGVKSVEGLGDLAGDWWLYEEVDLHPEAAFEFRVLLSESEFRVAADDVEFRVLPGQPGSPD